MKTEESRVQIQGGIDQSFIALKQVMVDEGGKQACVIS